jgi:hypothetical protein
VHIARFTWIALSLFPLLAASQSIETDGRRAQLTRERETAEARFREAVQVCENAFAQTACVDDARRERRREVSRVDAERSALDQTDRHRRTEERTRRVEAKQRAAAQRSAEQVPPAASAPRPKRQASAALAGERARARAPRAATTADPSASDRLAARSKRIADADAHAAAVRKRNADRAAKRAAAPPLPAAGASAPPIR